MIGHRFKARLSRIVPNCRAVIVLIALAALSSCYWNSQPGSGQLELDLRSISRSQVSAGLDYARIYVYADNMNTRVTIGDGTPYVEAPISGDSVTVNNVPAGNDYKLVITFGTKQGGVFVPEQYAWTDGQSTFDVTPGRQTRVVLAGQVTTVAATLAQLGTTSAPTPNFQYDLLGKDLLGVATDGSGYVAATTASTAYFGYAGGQSTFQSVSPGGTINSVTYGNFSGATPSSEYLLNTSFGIKEFSLTTGTLTATSLLPSAGPTGQVYDSQVFYDAISGAYYVYAENETGLVSVQCTGTGPQLSGKWIAVDFPGTETHPVFGTTFSNYVQFPISYIAANGGSFGILTSQFLTTNSPDFSYILNYAGFFTQGDLTVQSLAADNGGNLYIGTSSGVYKGGTSAIDLLAENVLAGKVGGTTSFNGSLIDQTAGHPIREVLYGQYQSSIVAALSNNLLIISDGSTSVQLPLPAVGLGDVNAITINPSEAFLIVAGTEGLTYVALQSIGF